EHPQPSYLRLGKAGEPCFGTEVPRVAPGQWLQVRPGEHPGGEALLSTGAALGIAMERAQRAEGPGPAVYAMPLWGMGSKALQAGQVAGHARVTSLEDHLRDAGFGSWLMESVCDRPELLARLRVQALDPRVCGTVGSQATLNAWGGLAP
ncbi:MAG: hypothetical protein RJA36_422, partial [Pseudomonadota bacterium]